MVVGMRPVGKAGLLEGIRGRLHEMVRQRKLGQVEVTVSVKPLTPEEAIGRPARRDFPIVEGKERVIEAKLLGTRAHAFTDSPADFQGTLAQTLELPFDSNRNRALFVAVMNALLAHLGYITGVVHCRDEEPEECSRHIADHVWSRWGRTKVGLIGLNPAIAEGLSARVGRENVRITDLNPENIGRMRFGVEVWDGRTRQERLVSESDVVLITGTTLVNGTLDSILEMVDRYKKEFLIYGVTASGVCWMLGWPRICPFGRTESHWGNALELC